MTRRHIIAILAPSGVVLLTYLLAAENPRTAGLWLIGIALGFVLHRSRFCVAAAMRDSYLFRDTGLARAVLLAMALTSISFGVVQSVAMANGQAPPGNIYTLSAATVAGSILFGVGLVPAGGCACSTLLRMGEGHLRYLWTLGGLAIGSALGAFHFGWWEDLPGKLSPIHFPTTLGWPGAIALQSLLLGGVWLLIKWWEKGRTA